VWDGYLRNGNPSEEKIRIVLDGLRGEDSIAELCRREGISQGIYYKWSTHCHGR
jgi:transposase-like protein